MNVVTLRSEPMSVNLHAIEIGGKGLLIDAGSGVQAKSDITGLRAMTNARIEHLFLTHVHVDHVGGAAAFKEATGANAIMHEAEADGLEKGDGAATLGKFIGIDVPPCAVDQRVKEGDTVEFGGRAFEVLLVPGHSPGHAALWEPESRSLFSGDVVFAMGSFGRVDFPGCDPRALIKSIERLHALDPVNLYPGHMEPVEGHAAEAIAWSLENAQAMIGTARAYR